MSIFSKKNKENIGMESNGAVVNSMRFRIWLNFMIVCFMIIGALWVVEAIFFPYQYGMYRKSQIEKAGQSMVSLIEDTPYDDEWYDEIRLNARITSNNYEGTVHFFYSDFYQDDDGEIVENEYFGIILEEYNLAGELGVEIEQEIRTYFLGFTLESDEFTYIDPLDEDVVYGAKLSLESVKSYFAENTTYSLDNGEFYLLLSSSTQLGMLTENTMQSIFLFATACCLLFSLFVAWIVSSHIASPIKQFSSGVKKIAKGDYTVTFGGNGMEEIDDLAENLNYVTDEIRKTENLRREFLANVSHDLRTPLTMVKAYAEMIRDISGNNNIKREEHSQIIINEADRLTALVNEISELSKLSSGVEELKAVETDLSLVARTVLERFKIYATRDGYKFSAEIEDDCMVMADTKRIEQVYYNLMTNAISYTGESKEVSLSVKRVNGAVRVSISDTGKGITQEDIAKIWDRYYIASQKKRQVVGSGLGLSIVKNILVAHKAKYGIDSVVGQGSTFWFEMPEFVGYDKLEK